MSKSLSESAAEILRASVSSAAKETAQKLPNAEEDLGGATTENPNGGDVGKKSAAGVKDAPKPTPKGDAKTAKTHAMEEVEADNEVVVEESAEEISEAPEATEVSEEELVEAKKEMMKGMVAKHKGSMKEDVDALFNGESLSEEFRTKATTIFEAAVQSRVEKVVEDVIADNDKILEEAFEEIKQELSEKVDEYLNYVVEQWLEDNKVAIETGLRAELTEDFINGLKNLFNEHYIEIPEEKIDVAEELAAKVVELEEAVANAAAEKNSLTEELMTAKKNESIRKICEGLTETQIAKMKSLAEGVEFTTEGEFNNKLAVIRENYFPVNKVISEVKVAEETSEPQPEVAQVPSYMQHYVNAITKTLPK
jgi:hypothetical protein